MTVVVLTAVPRGLRGHLTRWLLEIAPGVHVGHVSARVRELMWQRIIQYVDEGRALMVYTARNEQRLAFQVYGHDWEPVDFEGIRLMRRKTAPEYVMARGAQKARPASATPSDGDVVWKRRRTRGKGEEHQTD